MGWHGYQLVITEWSLLALSSALVAIRLYVQITAKRPHKPWRETLLVFAWFTQVVHAVVNTILWKIGQFEIWADPSMIQIPYQPNLWWLRLYILAVFSYPFGTWALRGLLLLIYLDLAPRHLFPRLFWIIVLGWVLCVISCIGVSFIWGLLQCFPYSITDGIWNMTTVCPGNMPWIWGMISSAILCDLVIYIIPMIIISSSKKLTHIDKLGAAAMFAFGFVNIATLLAGLIMMSRWNEPGYIPTTAQFAVSQFVQTIQVPTAIVIVCTPSLRVLGRWASAAKVSHSLPSRSRRDAGVFTNRRESMDLVGGVVSSSSSTSNFERKPPEHVHEVV